jgi:glycosyltransferase involved in cell wall biosynthesis
MTNLKDKKLALFFTKGISLKIWQKIGILDREIKPYKELAKNFKEIYFFTYGNKEDFEFQNILPENIKIVPKKWNLSSNFYSLFLPFFYRKKLKNIDILKTNQMNGAWTAVLTKWLYRKKLVVRCGYELLNSLEKADEPLWKKLIIELLEKIVYKSADKNILTSQKDSKFIENKFRIPSSKIEVIPNYIDVNLFKPLNIPKEKNGVIFVGRLEKVKNLINLIKATSNFSKKLILIGSGSLREKIENTALKEKTNIEFKNNIPNNRLPEELNKSEIFVLPSLREGFPKALLEAMSCGLPCIGTNVKGIREIIKHKENGYLCETDANSIRKAILEVLNNINLQKKIGQNARKTILENFNLEKILDKEIKIYETL